MLLNPSTSKEVDPTALRFVTYDLKFLRIKYLKNVELRRTNLEKTPRKTRFLKQRLEKRGF